MILLIDNYDSFVHNLARYLRCLGQTVEVARNDAITPAEVRARQPSAVVISPGPCTPNEAGCSVSVVRELCAEVPILGVCLGHQAIVSALGGTIVEAREPRHGRTSAIEHDGRGVFAGLPNPLTVCRYHSLVAAPETLPTCLEVSSRTPDGVIMSVRHRTHPVVGVQFHPESILTESGYPLLANFLALAGIATPTELPKFSQELVLPPARSPAPDVPITF